MAFSFDSLAFVAATLLLAASVCGWVFTRGVRAASRFSIRVALVLFAALGVAGLGASVSSGFAPLMLAVALLVSSLGSAALALGLYGIFARPVRTAAAAILLVLALALGLAAALLAAPALALAAQGFACALLIVTGVARLGENLLRGAQMIAGAFALLCAGLALMDMAAAIALLFMAAGLPALARASQLGVEQQRGRYRFGLIG